MPIFIVIPNGPIAMNAHTGFENHGGEISGSPARCLELCEAVGSTFFGVLYDPCNLMAEGTDYRHALATFGTRIVHVHFKDGLTRDGEWQRCGLGDGEIDFRWIISQLQSLGYDGDYALEFELKPEGGDNKAVRRSHVARCRCISLSTLDRCLAYLSVHVLYAVLTKHFPLVGADGYASFGANRRPRTLVEVVRRLDRTIDFRLIFD